MHEFPNTWKPIGANKDEKDDSLDALAAGLHPLPATSQQLRDINSLPDRAIQLRKICDKYANADPIVRNPRAGAALGASARASRRRHVPFCLACVLDPTIARQIDCDRDETFSQFTDR